MKRSSKRADTTGGRIRFAEVDAGPTDVPSWLTEVTRGKATTVQSVYPQAIPGVGDDDEDDDISEVVQQAPYVPHNRAANDAHVASPPKRETIPPAAVQPAPSRRSEIPRPPKAPDTLIDELIPRADEEAVTAIKAALEEVAEARARLLAEAEDDLFGLVRLIAERVVARELRTDPKLILTLVREGLTALSSGDACKIRLGRFYSAVADDLRRAVADVALEVSVVIDPTLATYGCVVETQWGRVDESVDARLRTLLDQLDAMRVRTGGE